MRSALPPRPAHSNYHLVADEYLRNPDLDANLYFNNLHRRTQV